MTRSLASPARIIAASILLSLTLAAPRRASADVNIQVDTGGTHQTIVGFGATTISLAFGATDNVPPALRTLAIDALYKQVRLNTGNLEIGPFESPTTSLYSPANDDADPNNFNAGGFNWTQSDNLYNKVVKLGAPFGLNAFWLGPAISEGYEFNWGPSLRRSNYQLYLAECGEHVAAAAIHWRDAYGITPRFMQLFNEPIGGNGELAGGSVQEIVDIVKAAGARLRKEGFATMGFVIPADETEQRSLDEATAVMNDPVARQYVGAIAYHPYPYGSTYASVPNILATSGAGAPSAAMITVRNQLRDLGRRYGVPVFMVEVSHSDVPFDSFDGVRGRAIQIHDEMVYADAAAFFGMNAMWDTVTHMQHYVGRNDPGFFTETDTVVLIDDAAAKIYITPMGRAIGHYARWVPAGSVRVDASSDDPLLQVIAFRDDADQRLALVVINNASAPRTLRVGVVGQKLSGSVGGEQSTAGTFWQSLTAVTPSSSSSFSVSVPAISVTTYAVTATSMGVDGGVLDGSGGMVDATMAVPDAAAATDLACGTLCNEVDGGAPVDGASSADLTAPPAARDATASSDSSDGKVNGDASGAGGAANVDGCGCRVAARDPRSARGAVAALGLLALIGLRSARRRRRG